MKLRSASVACAILMSIAAVPMFRMLDRNVPIERLIKIAKDRLATHPEEPKTLFLLGRLNSLSFALSTNTVDIYLNEGEKEIPTFHPAQSIQEKRSSTSKLTPSEIQGLNSSLYYYSQASTLEPENLLYAFGLAWMVKEAAPYAESVSWSGSPKPQTKANFLKKSLAMFRKIYAKAKPIDLKNTMGFNFKDDYLSREAGTLVIELTEKPGMGGLKPGEKADIQSTIKKVNSYGGLVTPIIFPLDGASFDDLVDNTKKVKFDLNGFDDNSSWPWVTNRAGFLVWDPEKKGKITSGRQLFGNATFWMFFTNGYEALASLDNDQNGWLEGSELRGIAVWVDRNENAFSEPGEVNGVEKHGITRINTSIGDTYGGMPVQLNGIHTKSRDIIPTYDWMPASTP